MNLITAIPHNTVRKPATKHIPASVPNDASGANSDAAYGYTIYITPRPTIPAPRPSLDVTSLILSTSYRFIDTTVRMTPTTVPAVIKTALPIFSAFIIGPVTCKLVGNAQIIANAKNDERILSAEETIMLLENTEVHISPPAEIGRAHV